MQAFLRQAAEPALLALTRSCGRALTGAAAPCRQQGACSTAAQRFATSADSASSSAAATELSDSPGAWNHQPPPEVLRTCGAFVPAVALPFCKEYQDAVPAVRAAQNARWLTVCDEAPTSDCLAPQGSPLACRHSNTEAAAAARVPAAPTALESRTAQTFAALWMAWLHSRARRRRRWRPCWMQMGSRRCSATPAACRRRSSTSCDRCVRCMSFDVGAASCHNLTVTDLQLESRGRVYMLV